MRTLTISGRSYAPQVNYHFSNVANKELATDNTTGFDNVVNGLLQGDVDTIVHAYHAAIPGGSSRPSEELIAEALDAAGVFDSEESATKEADSILEEMQRHGFLRVKMQKFNSTNKTLRDVLNKQLENMPDEPTATQATQRLGLERAVQDADDQIDHLNKILNPQPQQAQTAPTVPASPQSTAQTPTGNA